MSHDATPHPDPDSTPLSQGGSASARDENIRDEDALADPAQGRIAMELRQFFASIPVPPELTTEGARAVRASYESATQQRVQRRRERSWRLFSRTDDTSLRDRAPRAVSASPATEDGATGAGRRHNGRWLWVVSGSVAALVAILFGALFWLLRPAAPLPLGAVPSCRATVGDITLSVSQSYADATRTLVRFHTNRIDAAYPTWLALIDSQGNRYPSLTANVAYHIHTEGFIEFAPLPASVLGVEQQLILYAPEMFDPQDANSRIVATGPWSTCFHVIPQRGVRRTLDIAPVTSNGVTIQPHRLEVAPSGSPLDNIAGGARITVTVSGLNPATSVRWLQNFKGVMETGPQTPPFTETTGKEQYPGPGQVSLGVLGTAGPVIPTGLYVPTTTPRASEIKGGVAGGPTGSEVETMQRQTVGKSGAIDLQLIFFGPLALSSDGATTPLSFTALPITIVQPDGSYNEGVLVGVWQFQVPLALKTP
jgi:hypothetical protein